MASRDRAIECRRNLSGIISESIRIQPQCNTQIAEYLGMTSSSTTGGNKNYLTWSLVQTDLVGQLENMIAENNVALEQGSPIQDEDFFRAKYRQVQPILVELADIVRSYIHEDPAGAYNSSIARSLGLETSSHGGRENYFTWSLLQMMTTQGIINYSGQTGYRGSKPYIIIDAKEFEIQPFIYNPIKKYASKNEALVARLLIAAGIQFVPQKRFKGCHDWRELVFDFHLIDYDDVLEVQGRQHFEFVSHFHKTMEGFSRQQRRDGIKATFCRNEAIGLYYVDARNDSVRNITKQVDEIIRVITADD